MIIYGKASVMMENKIGIGTHHVKEGKDACLTGQFGADPAVPKRKP